MRRYLPYILFAILVCIFLWKPIFTGKALLPGDYLAQMQPWSSVVKAANPEAQWNPLQWDAIAQFYPWRVFYARSMKSGHIPLWNPHQFSGTPFLANGQSAVLYPFNLVFLALDPITAFTFFAALHLFLAQVFMYWLMRELGATVVGAIVGAIVFTFSAFMVLWLELPTFVSVAVWLPLVLLLIHRAVERRSAFYGMLAGTGVALAFLAGHFQIAFYVGLTAMFWWLWKLIATWRAEGQLETVLRVVVPFVAFALTAGLIAAPQVLSTQELAMNSHRVRAVTPEGYARFLSNAVEPYRLITAFVPDFYGNPSKDNYYLLGPIGDHIGSAADYMEFGLYAGVLPLLLALVGFTRIHRQPHVGFFAVLAVFALLSATGTPLNAPFYFLIPGFSALGGPNRILMLYLFGIAGLAGFGMDCLLEQGAERGVWRGRETNVGFLKGLLALHVVIFSGLAARIGAERFLQSVSASQPMQGFESPVYVVLLIASGTLVVLRTANRIGRSVFGVVAVALVVVDLFAFGINYNPTCDRAKVYPDTPLTKELQQLTKNGQRIAPINPRWSLFQTPKAILPPNAAMVYGLYDVQGYDSLFTRAYKNAMDKAEGVDSSPIENGNMVLQKGLPGAFTHARYLLTQRDEHVTEADRGGEHPIPPLLVVDGIRVYTTEGVFGGLWAGYHREVPRAQAFMWNLPTVWRGPNRIHVDQLRPPDRYYAALPVEYVCFDTLRYPGWVARSAGEVVEMSQRQDRLEVDGQIRRGLEFSFEPFTFRFGLFLMLVGVGALAGVGTYRCLCARKAK